MRIVHFIDTLRSGGKERQLVELLKGLVQYPNIETDVIIMSDNIHYSYIQDLGVNIHFLIRRTKKDPTIFFKLYRLLRRIKPDILHSWESMCSIYALPVVKLLKIKFVNGFLRNAPPGLSILNKVGLRARITFPFSDAIVANSQAGLAAYNAPSDKSYCVYNGFDFSRIENLEPVDKVKKKFGIKYDKVVGMVASFSENKDYVTFIEAAKDVIRQRDDVCFVTVGDGKNLEYCKSLVPEDMLDRILFLGRQKIVESIINVFDVGVLISNTKVHGEGISNSIMEYMALGKPVIANDCGGNRELVTEENGILIENMQKNSLCRSLLQLIDADALMILDPKNNMIRNKFNLANMTHNYIDLYENITHK